VQSVNHSLSTIVFVALHFFLFNVGDLLGRSLPSLSPRLFLLRKMKVVAFLCLLRTAFVPLLAYCNITTPSSSSPSVLSTALFGDVTFFILMILLGISNGLLATTIFVIGPHQDNLTEPNDQNLAAGLLSWWLTFGLAIGSLSSFIVAASV
jgi:equilibrative nucleoside transporter 1/2/3